MRAATAPEDGLSLVADAAGEVVGHAMFSPGPQTFWRCDAVGLRDADA